MPILKRENKYQGLKDIDVLVDESGLTSKYFNVYDFPETLPQGRSSFLIAGSPFLKNSVELKVEILDAGGNTIYTEAVPGYLEGGARRISVEIYDDVIPGDCFLYLVGELKENYGGQAAIDRNTDEVVGSTEFGGKLISDTNILTASGRLSESPQQVPKDFQGVYNVRYTRPIFINSHTTNTLPIYLYEQPRMTIKEIVKGFVTQIQPSGSKTITGSIKATPLNEKKTIPPEPDVEPAVPGTSANFPPNVDELKVRQVGQEIDIYKRKRSSKMQPLRSSTFGAKGRLVQRGSPEEDEFNITIENLEQSSGENEANKVSSAHLGAEITITKPYVDPVEYPRDEYDIPDTYTSQVKKITNDSTLVPVDEFFVTRKDTNERVAASILPPTGSEPNFTMSFDPTPQEVISQTHYRSFADIIVANLRTFSGDIYKAKIYAKSKGTLGDFEPIYEAPIESPQLLVDPYSVTGFVNEGYFYTQSIVDNYWVTSSASTATTDSSQILDGVLISGSNYDYGSKVEFETSHSYHLEYSVPYTVSFNSYYYKTDKVDEDGNVSKDFDLQVYTDASAVGGDSGSWHPLGKVQTTSEDTGLVESVFTTFVSPKSTSGIDPLLKLKFELNSGKAIISDVLARPHSETNFNPNYFRVIVPMPHPMPKKPDQYDFLCELYDVNNNVADTIVVKENVVFAGAPINIDGDGNLLSGSMYLGNVEGSGIELHGGTAYLRSIGYDGFDKTLASGSGGFMIFSGSVSPQISASETYQGVGLEILDAHSATNRYLKFGTNPSTFEVVTDQFFLGNAGAHISSSGGSLTITSSNFHLDKDGDVNMAGTVTATAGKIGDFDIIAGKISGSNITMDAVSSSIYKTDQGPGTDDAASFAHLRDEYYIDFTPTEDGVSNYYIKMGPNFMVDKEGILIASGAEFIGTITASAGLIGGFHIGSASLYSGTSEHSPNFYISGSASGNRPGMGTFISSSKFQVTADGDITGSQVLFTGGKIAGATIEDDKLSYDSNWAISASSTANEVFISSSKFNVKQSGDVTGSQVLFTGGKIAGWEIEENYISKALSGSAAPATSRVYLAVTSSDAKNIGQGLTIYRDDDDTLSGDVKIVRVGQLSNTTDLHVTASNDYGFQIIKNKTGTSYENLVYFGKTQQQISGFEILADEIKDVGNNLRLKSSGQITASAAKIHGDSVDINVSSFELDANEGDLQVSSNHKSMSLADGKIILDGGNTIDGASGGYIQVGKSLGSAIQITGSAARGTIRSGKHSAADSGSGFWLSSDTDGVEFHVGSGSYNKIDFDSGNNKLEIASRNFELNTDTIDISSRNKRIQVYDTNATTEYIRIGEISTDASDRYGIKIYDGTGVANSDLIAMFGELGNKIAGWEFTTSQIRSVPAAGLGELYGENETGLIIHSGGSIETSDFASGLKGWRISSVGNGSAEFENMRVRGTLRTTVFEKESVNVVGGQLMVANSTTLEALRDQSGSLVLGVPSMSAADTTMSVANVSGFRKGEILKAKKVHDTGFAVEYMLVCGSLRYTSASNAAYSGAVRDADMGNVDPDGLAGELHLVRGHGGTRATSSDSGVNINSAINATTDGDNATSEMTISTTDNSVFSVQDIIRIDNERFKVTSILGSDDLLVIRDYHDTTRTAHSSGADIHKIDTNAEFLAGLVSTAQTYQEGQVIVSTGVYDTGSDVSSGYILMNANPNDVATPYMDIVERTGSGVYDLQLRSRLGDLSGLSSGYLYGNEEPGFGLYTENGFFRGSITAQTGSFAGIVHVATEAGGLETGQKISIGREVSASHDGIWINRFNYWFTTADFRVGDATNYIQVTGSGGNFGNDTRIKMDTFTLEAGNLDINSTDETIRLGSVTDFAKDGSAKGILMGKESSGNYDFFVGKEDGNYIHWDDSDNSLKVVGTIEIGSAGSFTPDTATQNQLAALNATTGSLSSETGSLQNATASLYTSASAQYLTGSILRQDSGSMATQVTLANDGMTLNQADGTNLASYGSTIRIGKSGEGRVEITDTALDMYDGAGSPVSRVNLNSSGQLTLGKSSDNRVQITDTSFKLYEGSNERINITSTGVQILEDGNNFTEVSASGLSIHAGGQPKAYFTDSWITLSNDARSQKTNSVQIWNGGGIGIYRDANNYASMSSDGMELYQGGNSVSSFGSSVRLGKSGEARTEISDTAIDMYDGASSPAKRVNINSSGVVTLGGDNGSTDDTIVLTPGSGIKIHESNVDFLDIHSSGMNVHAGNASTAAAEFGTTITLRGNNSNDDRIVIDSDGVDIYEGGNLRTIIGQTTVLGSGGGTVATDSTDDCIRIDSNGVKLFNDSSNYASMTSDGMKLYKGGNQVAEFGSTITLAPDVSAATTDSVVIAAGGVKIYDTSTDYVHISSDGLKVYDGDASNAKAQFGATTYVGATANEHIKIENDLLEFYDGGTAYGSMTAGIWTIGQVTNNQTRLQMATGSLAFISRNGSGVDTYTLEIKPDGTIEGQDYLIEKTRLFGAGEDETVDLYDGGSNAGTTHRVNHVLVNNADGASICTRSGAVWSMQGDWYARNFTLNNSPSSYGAGTLDTNGYRLFVKDTLTIGSNWTIQNSGGHGSNGASAAEESAGGEGGEGAGGGTLAAGTDGGDGGIGGGGVGQGIDGAGGGGGGGCGGHVFIAARKIVNAGAIKAEGGNGGGGGAGGLV